ncbi:MAG TPA: HipA domain-containing protein, partial [Acidimicrobiales bacterium]
WLIAGTDAHAKNYSLLLANDQVRLAPLYDIASALPYGVHEKTLRLAMKIGGDYGVYPHRNTWPQAADDLGLDADTLMDRVRELALLAPDVFADAARAPDVKELGRPLPARMVDLISDRAVRCLSVMGNPNAAAET